MNYATSIVSSDPARAAEILAEVRPRKKYAVNRLTWLSAAHLNMGKITEAIDAMGEACDLAPRDCDLLCRKAMLHLHHKDLDSAKSCVGLCLAIDPTYEEALQIQHEYLAGQDS